MNFVKKTMALMLILSILICSFSSCISVSAVGYMLKGEFFNTYLEYFNFTSEMVTFDEMDETDDYSLEAETILEWGLLSEEEATKNLEKPITKEIAILCCMKTMSIKQQGNIDDIKDADLCDYPQEMADAYANGIVDLDNGYIDCKEKLTYEECEDMLQRTMKAIATAHYEDGNGTVTYGAADIILDELNPEESLEIIDISNYPELQQYLSADEKLIVAYLSKTEDTKPTEINKADALCFIKVNNKMYQNKFAKLKCGAEDGDIVTIRSIENISDANDDRDIIGRYVDVLQLGMDSYAIVIDTSIPDEEKMASVKVEKIGKKITDIDFEQIEKELSGFKISANSTGDTINLTVTKEFNMSENKYNNWRDATETITATVNASISNIYISTNNLEGFFKSQESSEDNPVFKLTCDTTEKLTLSSSEMRFTPDSNRNGGFISNLTKSRMTNGKGASAIKIGKARITIPNTGIEIEIYAYLCVSLSGKISIQFGQIGHGFEVSEVNGKVHTKYLKADDENKELEIQCEYDVGVRFDAFVHFLCIKNVVSGYIQGGVKGSGSIYVYGTSDDIKPQGDSEVAYCMHFTYAVYVKGGLYDDNLIGKVFSAVGGNLSKLKLEYVAPQLWLPSGSLHYEEIGYVDECTRKLEYMKDSEVCASADEENGKFTVSSYKLHIPAMSCGTVYITEMPISESELKKYPKGIQVKSKNQSVAKAYYYEQNNIIMVEAVNPGSTEVEVFVRKNKKTGKEYAQTFSVTVEGNTTSAYISVATPKLQKYSMYSI